MLNIQNEDDLRLYRHIEANAGVVPAQLQGWADDAVRVTKLVAGGDTDMVPLFWIRCYGIMVDTKSEMSTRLKLRDKVVAKEGPPPEILARWWLMIERVVDAALALRGLFDHDELVYFEYRRHTEAHPLQHKYRLRRQKDGSLSDVHCNLLDGKALPVEDFERIAQSVITAYDDEPAIAVQWAKRSRSQVETVGARVREWVTMK